MVLATLATALYLASSLLLARGLAAQQRERMPAALWLAAIAVALHATLHLLAWRTTGSVDLRFLRPVRPGDSVTFKGKVTAVAKEPDGYRISVEVSATNQKGDTTAAGTGACIVPSILMPAED